VRRRDEKEKRAAAAHALDFLRLEESPEVAARKE
jgi:hypothetical protein